MTNTVPQDADPETAGPPIQTRILIVDDHQLVRFGVATLLEGEPNVTVCGEAANEAQAIQLARELAPDLAIVDISLAEGNGLDLIKRLKGSHPDLAVIVLSMHSEELFAERALRAGAVGYVCKQAPARTILKAIQQVLSGQVYLSEGMTAQLVKQATGQEAAPPSPVESLSDREADVFHRLGQGMTVQQIAAQLHLSPKTVSTYRDRIRQKLNLSSSAELSRRAYLWLLENS